MTLSKRFRYTGLVVGMIIGVTATIVGPAHAQSAAGISTDASDALTRMSKTLQADQFSFRSHTLRAYVGANGELLHVAHTMKTVVRRPDRLAVDIVGDDGAIKMIYDGKSLVVYSVAQKQYARIPAPAKIGEMLDVAQDRMQVDFPLADLLTEDPGKAVLSGVTSGGQVGTATIDGVPCRHFFFVQSPDLELELWLEDNDRSLPRRVFVTYRSLPGHPTFLAELSDWDFTVKPADTEFDFQPPAGVTQVELTAKANAAPANTK